VDPVAVNGINPWRLAEIVETWGKSNFPRAFGGTTADITARLELTRCQAGEKPFWMTELQGGHFASGLSRSPDMRPRDIRLWNWMAVATGAKGIVYWAYHTEATGGEAGGFGLLARDGSPTERVLEAAEDHRLIDAHWDLLKDYRPQPEVAILFDQDNALLTFAMTGNEDASTTSFRGYYKAFWYSDLFVDFIEPQTLETSHYKLIVAPWHLIGKKATCDALRRFVEAGGTLVLETAFGMFDERMFFNPVIPPHGLAGSFGYREGESLYVRGRGEPAHTEIGLDFGQFSRTPSDIPASERIYVDAHLDFTEPISVTVSARTYITPITVSGATVLARYESMPVAAKKNVGQGQVYYIGTNLGASIGTGDAGAMALMHAIIASRAQPPVTAENVRPRLIEGAGRALLTVFNEGPEDRDASIKIPRHYRRATDLHSGESKPIENSSVSMRVPFEGVSVLLLEK
jgi:beta-galactosidase